MICDWDNLIRGKVRCTDRVQEEYTRDGRKDCLHCTPFSFLSPRGRYLHPFPSAVLLAARIITSSRLVYTPLLCVLRLRIFACDSVLSAQLSCIRISFHSFSTHTYIGRLVLFPLLPLYILLLLDESLHPSSEKHNAIERGSTEQGVRVRVRMKVGVGMQAWTQHVISCGVWPMEVLFLVLSTRTIVL
jgi:hypothetical protein